ncbi:receptor-like protein EIX2 [Lotus japonicus]|uniref:receptor-like protein EIX2 n=1 Tax=Lotus japonicus TaxID=34305 RepID=UPI00258C8DBE|nr:receptor-like protein EIX2 [Lotus japonicus]
MFSSPSRMVIIFLWFLCAITVNLGMSHETNNNMTIRCNRKDQDLLSMFKQSIKDPSNMLSSWSIEKDCCNWKGVKCTNISGRVTELHLHCFDFIYSDEYGDETLPIKCLGGKINFSLLKLDFLTFLDLSQNDFQAIHFESVLGYTKSQRSHKLPPKASSSSTNFSSLVHLDLSNNYNLHMDNLRWLPRFSSLKYLDLSSINLSNETLWLQSMVMLPSLMELRLEICQLNGINPSIGYVNFTSLAVLDISMNSFHSEIPNWLFNLGSGISDLDLSYNSLRGQIPATMLNFQHLKSLRLGYNKLNGTIPVWMGQFKNLENLDLSNNFLSGPLPATIGNISSLTYLDIGDNNLNGSLPRTLGQLSKLEALLIGHNSRSGNLSEKSFTKLSSLKRLRLESTAFIFNFGTHWKPLFQLEEISMSKCKLGPGFPSWLYTQRPLFYLDLSSSGLSFNVEDKFQSFITQLLYLFLSNNSITGDISTTLFTGTSIDLSYNNFTGWLPRLSAQVSFFNIANNSFSGPIYPLMCHNMIGRQNLEVLDMSHNLLSGELPDCWMHWQSLFQVNLEGNDLSGEIPDSMGWLVKLETLRLRNNSLSGNIPSSFKNCKKLWFLDLSFNEFTGDILQLIGSLNMALLLRSNKFNGNIPSQICQLSNLLVLDIANNRLSGPIPKCLFNITTMVTNTLDVNLFYQHYYRMGETPLSVASYQEGLPLFVKGLDLDYWNSFEYVRIVDLSSNNLSGQIPQELFRLIALQSLNLSCNHLVGNIPSNIGQMKFLESLDLSRNLLSGEIPQSMSNLSFLSRLNLSYNNFDGRIPLSTQLQSFEESSYIGNPELCGPPLPKNCAQEKKPNDFMEVSKDGDFNSSFRTGVGVGLASAFWGVFGTLLFIRKWRHAYFRFLDSLYVIIVVNINHFRNEGL